MKNQFLPDARKKELSARDNSSMVLINIQCLCESRIRSIRNQVGSRIRILSRRWRARGNRHTSSRPSDYGRRTGPCPSTIPIHCRTCHRGRVFPGSGRHAGEKKRQETGADDSEYRLSIFHGHLLNKIFIIMAVIGRLIFNTEELEAPAYDDCPPGGGRR
jgi:hypothetical protein